MKKPTRSAIVLFFVLVSCEEPDKEAPSPCLDVDCNYSPQLYYHSGGLYGSGGYCSEGYCICNPGYEGEHCEIKIQKKACCECLNSSRQDSSACLRIELDTCIGGASFAATCGCWEYCYAACEDVGYPYENRPNGCR